ncbi:MAG: acyl carrier protein, partial [Planctomycetaceae bacterium]|nr:acyl carrier protein [Planctomycetaceae bacterium]
MGIDLLDIVYRLEKAFSIKIERDDLIPVDIFNDTQGKYVVNGELTILGLKEIKRRMPSANLSSFEKKPTIQSLATI